MSGETHVAVAAAVGAAVGLHLNGDPQSVAVAAALAAAVGKLPDQLEGRVFQHRKTTHSVWIVAALAGLLHWLAVPELVAWSLLAGYVSHIVIDLMTVSGVYVLAPIHRRFRLRLVPVRIVTGGAVDRLTAAIAGAYLLIVSYNLMVTLNLL